MIPEAGAGYRLVHVSESPDPRAEVWLYSTGEWGGRGVPDMPYLENSFYRVPLDVELEYPHWPDVKVSEESLFDDRDRSGMVVVWGAGVLVFVVGFVLGLCF